MPKLYIANPSHQHLKFMFRVPGQPGVRQVPISSGRQEMVFEGPSDEIDNIIRQHRHYGLISAKDASARGYGYVGACYSVDAPIKVDTYRIIHEENTDELTALGKKRRQDMALVAAEQLRSRVSEDLPGVDINMGSMELGLRNINENGDTDELFEENKVTEAAAPTKGRNRR